MDEQKTIYIAALLHDIGKFLERAKSFKNEGDAIKKDWNVENYGHRFYSAYFIRRFKDDKLFKNQKSNLKKLILSHHPKEEWTKKFINENILGKIIYISDHLSSSERRYLYKFIKWKYYAYCRNANIFSRLYNYDKDNEWGYHQFKELDIQNFFKVEKKLYSEKNEIRPLVKNFFSDIFPNNNIDKLYSYLYKYTINIPSQIRWRNHAIPDITLFDHLRSTAAIAISLFKENELNKNNLSNEDVFSYKLGKNYKITPEELAEKYLFTLLQCDFSGIQSFIFDIDSKGAAKALKGRSAYIQVLSDVVAKYLIDKLELEEANIIYNGGGNFYILMPQCLEDTARKELKYISKVMYKAHKGDLYLAHGFTPLNMKDFKCFAGKWYNSRRVVVQNKINRWNELGDDRNKLFEPFEAPEKKYDTPFYKSFEELTRQIKSADYILYEGIRVVKPDFSDEKLLNSYEEVFAAFGYKMSFSEKETQIAENLSVYKLNDTDFGDCTGFKFMVNKLPQESDFSKIAEFAKGDKKLGLLKMDMDNLGEIFKEGLGKEDRSISRVATLSRNIHLFFEGYLNTILDDKEFTINDKRIIYPIYAGGDDLLFIGPYDKMIDLAQRIHDDFKQFVAQNNNVNISGALVIIDDKFPLKEAARQVEEHLKKAKSQPKKDSISIMGVVLSWEEYDKMIDMKNILLDLIENKDENKRENRSLLQKILNSTKGFESINRDIEKGKIDIQKLWRFKYYLRNMKKENKEKQKKLVNWYEDLFLKQMIENNEYNPMILPIATKITELLTKKI